MGLELAQRHVPDQPLTQLLRGRTGHQGRGTGRYEPVIGFPAMPQLPTRKRCQTKKHRSRSDGPCHRSSGLGTARPRPEPRPSVLPVRLKRHCCCAAVALRAVNCGAARCLADVCGPAGFTGGSWTVQYMHRDAAIGMVLRHSGQSRSWLPRSSSAGGQLHRRGHDQVVDDRGDDQEREHRVDERGRTGTCCGGR